MPSAGQAAEAAGQTAAAVGQPAASPGRVQTITDILLPRKSTGFDVLARRRFYLLRSPAELATRAVRKHIPGSRRVQVLSELRPDTLRADSEAAWCRIFGGLLTSVEWLREAVEAERPPKAISLRGLSTNKALVLYLSEDFKSECTQSSVALTILAEENSKVSIVDSLQYICARCIQYKEEKGLLYRPWSSTAILVAAQSEAYEILHQAGAELPAKVVRTLEEFLNEFSTVQKGLVCPGHWHSGLQQ